MCSTSRCLLLRGLTHSTLLCYCSHSQHAPATLLVGADKHYYRKRHRGVQGPPRWSHVTNWLDKEFFLIYFSLKNIPTQSATYQPLGILSRSPSPVMALSNAGASARARLMRSGRTKFCTAQKPGVEGWQYSTRYSMAQHGTARCSAHSVLQHTTCLQVSCQSQKGSPGRSLMAGAEPGLQSVTCYSAQREARWLVRATSLCKISDERARPRPLLVTRDWCRRSAGQHVATMPQCSIHLQPASLPAYLHRMPGRMATVLVLWGPHR